MYCDFYQLRERPFNVTSDPKFLYLNASYREALASLHYGVTQRKGFITLIGEAGTGKTTLLKKLLDDMDTNTRTVFVFNTNVSFDEILEYIFGEFDLPVQNGKRLYMLQRLNAFLLEELRNGRNVALLIDEAQDLDFSVLEDLRLLSNLETAKEKILQIVLSGQPELGQKLGNSCLRQLRQRIAINCRLQPLSRDELAEYIQSRLTHAGSADLKLFSRDAEDRIFEISKGIPRLVNIVCDNALVIGYALGKKRIGADVVSEASADLFSGQPIEMFNDATVEQPAVAAPPVARRWTWSWGRSRVAMAGAAGALVAAGVAFAALGGGLPWRGGTTVSETGRPRQPLDVIPAGSALADGAGKDRGVPAGDRSRAGEGVETREAWRPRDEPAAESPTHWNNSGVGGSAAGAAGRPTGAEVADSHADGPAMPETAVKEAQVAARPEPAVEMVPPVMGKAEAKPDAKAERPPDVKAERPPDAKAERPPDAKAEPPPDAKAEPPPDAKAEPPPKPEPMAMAQAPLAGEGKEEPAVRQAVVQEVEKPKIKPNAKPETAAKPEPVKPVAPKAAAVAKTEPAGPRAAGANAPASARERAEGDVAARRSLGGTDKLELESGREQAVTARAGDTVSSIAIRRYGLASTTVLDLMKMANPEIRDIDVISAGQRLKLPKLDEGFALLREDDGRYALLLMSTPVQRQANEVEAGLRRHGIHAEVRRGDFGRGRSVYRLLVPKLADRGAAVATGRRLQELIRDDEQIVGSIP